MKFGKLPMGNKKQRKRSKKCLKTFFSKNGLYCIFWLIALLAGVLFFKSTKVSNRLFIRSFVYSLRSSFYGNSHFTAADVEFVDDGDYGDEYLDEDEELEANDLNLDEFDDDDEDEEAPAKAAVDDPPQKIAAAGSEEVRSGEDDVGDEESSDQGSSVPKKGSFKQALAAVLGYKIEEWKENKEQIVNTHKQFLKLKKENDRGVICVMFTTLMSSSDHLKRLAQENTLRALSTLKPDVHTIVFTNDKHWVKYARALGVEVETRILTNKYGTPYLHGMFKRAFRHRAKFYGYTNGDILYGENLITSLHVIAKEIDEKRLHERILITGRRLEHKLSQKDYISQNPYEANEKILQFSKLATLGVNNAQDYFIITPSTFNWNVMPKYVIGRPAYDNCLVHMVNVRSDISGVDATNTIDAVHQVGRDGVKAGHKRRPDRGWNKVRCRGRWVRGMTDLMKHMTFFKNNEITCKIRPKQKRGHLWKLYKKILQPQMRIQDMAFISVKLKPYSRVLIVEGFAYNNFVANLAKKVKNGNIVYMEMFPKCMRTKKLLKTYKNVQHICAPPHVMRHIGKPSLWKDYRDLYESKLSPLKMKFDAILVKGRARPQFAVWCLFNNMVKKGGYVYMFDTALGGRTHYKAAEDFFTVAMHDKTGKGIKRLKPKPPIEFPDLNFDEWLMEYNL